MVRETRIRERLAVITDPKERASVRVEEVAQSLLDLDRGVEVDRSGLVIRFLRSPHLVSDRGGTIIGIDAMVRVFEGGVDLQVDPHRVCINPPTLVPDGTTHTEIDPRGLSYEVDNYREDPREAYLAWLEASLQASLAGRR